MIYSFCAPACALLLFAATFLGGGALAQASPCSHGIYLNTKAWMGSDRTDADLETLAKQMADASMGRVYIRANIFKDPEDKPRLTRLIAALKKRIPSLQVYGYLGAGIKKGNYPDPTAQAKKFASLGFDGIQIDYEPTPPAGDPKYLAILKLARTAAPGLKLSVAGSWLAPDHTLPAASQPKMMGDKPLLEWEAKFYSQVLDLVDDVMVMNYDTTIKTPDAYADFTRWQHDHLRDLAKGKAVKISIGLPTRVAGRAATSNKKAEDFAVGMRALDSRMAGGQCPDAIVGTSFFDDSGLKDADWAELARLAKFDGATSSTGDSGSATGSPPSEGAR